MDKILKKDIDFIISGLPDKSANKKSFFDIGAAGHLDIIISNFYK